MILFLLRHIPFSSANIFRSNPHTEDPTRRKDNINMKAQGYAVCLPEIDKLKATINNIQENYYEKG